MSATFVPADVDVRHRIRRAVRENMCVEAGAGTGKTTVLVERIVQMLRTGHARIDEIVVITFTEKAAAELSARVRRELEVAGAASFDPAEQERLQTAIRGLSAAHIETIHAFASSLLRERPIEALLDPGFEVLDELPRQLAFEAAWNEWVTDEMAQEPPPAALVDALNLGFEWRWVREAAQRLNSHREVLPLAPYAPEHVDIDEFISAMREVFAKFEKWMGKCKNERNVTLTEMQRMRELHGQIIALHSRGEPAESLLVEAQLPDTFHGAKTEWLPPSNEPKDLLKKGRGILEEAQGRIKRRATARLVEWVAGFVEFYSNRRKAMGQADFDDLLIWARNLIRENAEVRQYFQSKYRCILVDEFQDTDPLQAEMILRLCSESDPGGDWRAATLRPGSLFVVGDPKQSIYRFRRADITMYDDVKQRVFGGAVEEITQNFRSVKPVIDWVNGAFAQLIAYEPGIQPGYIGLEHDPALLHGGVSIMPGEAPKDHGRAAKDIRIAEAKAIASLIRQQVDAGAWLVRDRESDALRPAALRDVAILIPTRTDLQLYEEQLSLAGIEYRHEGGRTFFQRQEVRELVAILRALDDPGDQVAVIAALRSPAFACSDEDLFLHRAIGRFDYLTLAPGAEGLVADSFRALRTLARRRHEKTLPEFVRDVVDSLRLVECAMLQPQGEQAASNILKIIDQARAFAAAKSAGGLRSFVRWLKENTARASDETDASITEETDDAVRIVTVHMSKGLEFGVVIFANMSADRPDWTNVIVDRGRIGGAFHVRFGAKESGYRTPGYEEAEQTEQAHARAEQVRLLYVAATRARDFLIAPFFHYEGVDPHKSVAELKSLNDHFRSVGLDESDDKIDITALPPIVGTLDPIRVGAVTTDDEQLTSIIEDREAWQAERQVVLDIGSTGLRVHTATSLKAQCEYGVSGEEEVKRGGATEFGSAVHDVLERIDLAESNTVRDVAIAVATQCGMKDRVDEMVQCVENVVAHDVMKRALSSPRMLREVVFTAPLPDADDGGLAEGRMDLLFVEDGELVVVDFKTDRVDERQAPGRAAMYRNQALVYAWAAGRTTGIPVREVVFLFARGPAEFSYTVDATFLAEAEDLLRGAPVLV